MSLRSLSHNSLINNHCIFIKTGLRKVQFEVKKTYLGSKREPVPLISSFRTKKKKSEKNFQGITKKQKNVRIVI